MKKLFLCSLLFTSMLLTAQAQSYCVLGGDEQEVLEESDMHKCQSVASISKIMTALLAIEHGNLEDTWNVSDAILQADGSSLYLRVGQKVSLKSLLYGLMLRSGNDAAIEIAQHVGNDVTHFVEMMNERAKEIGMVDTIFHNPSGLDETDGGNISSAYDMALLMSTAMKNPMFQEVTGSKYYTTEWNLRWKNKNKLLFDYGKTTGGKTGFTKKAGRTLVSSASDESLQSIVVTLNMADDFVFHETKHDTIFQAYQGYELVKEGTYHIQGYEVIIPQSIHIALKQDGSDTLQVASEIQNNTYILTLTKNGNVKTFTFEAEKMKHKRGGWFS